jgi:uncharacterized protein (DUF1800 family)
MDKQAIALNRFGLGRRPWEAPPADPRGYLLGQFARYTPTMPGGDGLASHGAVAEDILEYRAAIVNAALKAKFMPAAPPVMVAPGAAQPIPPAAAVVPGKPPVTDAKKAARVEMRQFARAQYIEQVGVRVRSAVATDTPFVERLVHFWANHFAVSVEKLESTAFAGLMEFEAIRPHVTGKFEDMLIAVEQHPAMLLFLDQARSVGPESPLGSRAAGRGGNRKIGLNENLGREILELHTLGVRSGYSQADVTEFARALTGWTVSGLGAGPFARRQSDTAPGDFIFSPQLHQPGSRKILGKSYAQDGEAQARAVLADLARHPATARHLAFKLARHFVSDDPPPALVARLEKAYLASGGDLPAVYRALIDAPESWAPTPAKFRDPWLWTVAALRTTSAKGGAIPGDIPDKQFANWFNQLGQPVWKSGSPAGWDDVAASWAAPDALLRRVELAQRFATILPANADARKLAPEVFGPAVSQSTRAALDNAESPKQALALMFAAPEMLRC